MSGIRSFTLIYHERIPLIDFRKSDADFYFQ